MSVDVSYEGVVLQRGAEVRETAAGLYVALEAPMPVGTALALDEGGRAHRVKVARVHEGIGPGVLVVGDSLPKADVVIAPMNLPPPSVPAPAPAPANGAAAPKTEQLQLVVVEEAKHDVLDDGRVTIPSMKAVDPADYGLAPPAEEPPPRKEKEPEPADDGKRGKRKRKKTLI